MLKKNKKNLLLAGGLLGAIITSSAVGIALSSCTTTSSTTRPTESETEYTTQIDWTDSNTFNSLTKDDQGVYYSDDTKTNVIALSPSSALTTVVLPSTVTTISGYVNVTTGTDGNKTSTQTGAFQNNTTITSITVQSGSKLVTIDKLAFSGCTSLETISNTSGLIKIGASAFEGCTKLQTFSLSKIQTVGSSAFKNCTTFNGDVDLNNVNSVGASAFYATNITSVDTNKNSYLSSIGANAFQNCTKLVKVTLPSENISSLTTIGESAFSGCTLLTTVAPSGQSGFYATSSITSIGGTAFANTIITSIDFSATSITNSKYELNTSFNDMHLVTSVKLSNTLKNIGQTMFNNCGDQGEGFDLDLPSSIVNFRVTESNQAPFANSGLKSIDMSKITSYDVTSGNANIINDIQFRNATKLETVILKPGTTSISSGTFENCTSLKVVKEPSQTDVTSGYVATSSITTVGKNAFKGAFAEEVNATVDLSAMTVTTAPAAFTNSKVKTLKLPSTITTISASSFDNMTNLSDVNFSDLTKLTSIAGGNFNNTQLTTIDLSNITSSLSFTGVNTSSAKLFTGLPTDCVVSLPNTMTTFSNVFMDTNNSPVTFNFPKGFPTTGGFANISDTGVLTFTSGSQQASNLKNVDLTPNTTITSVGANTFFGSTKLERLTLSGKSLTTSSTLFTGANISSANTNKTTTPSTYATANLPFGNNTTLTSLNYANFTTASTTTTASMQALFNTTNQSTWDAVAKIVNSLSNYSYADGDATTDNASKIPANLSTWAADTSKTSTSKILDDSTVTLTSSGSTLSKVVFNNCFSTSANSSLGVITLGSNMASNTFIHNGVTWTYNNDGTKITLTGNVNMYKATSGNASYLTFFNTQQVQAQPSQGSSTTYNIPNQQKVTVSLVIATVSK